MKKNFFKVLVSLFTVGMMVSISSCHKHVHEYTGEEVTTQPTCTEVGVKTKTCSCGETITESIPALGHHYVTDEAIAPTCTADGKTAGEHCDRCNEVKTAQTVIPATGHTFSTEWTHDSTKHWHAATCGDTEERQDEAEHTFTYVDNPEAGHASNGLRIYTCSVCGYTYSEELDAVGHETNLEWVKDETHHWQNCSCGEQINKAEHTWDEGKVTLEPTCKATGTKEYTCTVCGQTKTEEIPVGDHKAEQIKKENLITVVTPDGSAYAETPEVILGAMVSDKNLKPVEITEATQVFLVTGSANYPDTNVIKFGTSSKTGKLVFTLPEECKTSKLVVKAGAWAAGDTLSINGVLVTPAALTTDMEYETFTFEFEETNVITIEANKRIIIKSIDVFYGSEDKVTKINEVTPTCLNEGGYDLQKVCATCGVQIGELEHVTLPVVDHTYGELIAQVNPSCTEAGVAAHYECSVCNKLFDSEKVLKTTEELVIPATGHSESGEGTIVQKSGKWVLVDTCPVCSTGFEKDVETHTISEALDLASSSDQLQNVEFTVLGFGANNTQSSTTFQYLIVTDGVRVAQFYGLNNAATCPNIVVSGFSMKICGEEVHVGDTYLASVLIGDSSRYVGATANTVFYKGSSVDVSKFELALDGERTMDANLNSCTTGGVYHYTATAENPLYFTQNGTHLYLFGAGSDGFSAGSLQGNNIADAKYDGVAVGSNINVYARNIGEDFFTKNFGKTYTFENGLATSQLSYSTTPLGTYAFTGEFNVCYIYGNSTYRMAYILQSGLELTPIYNYGLLKAAVAPTCTEDGRVAHYYDETHDLYFNEQFEIIADVVLPNLGGHTYSDLVPEVPATDDTNGMKAHYRCTVCEKYFELVEEEYVEVTSSSLIIPALLHEHSFTIQDKENLDSICKPQTLHTYGEYYYVCSCGVVGLGGETWVDTTAELHTVAHAPAVAAKCDEDGNIEFWHCETCNKFWNAETLEEKDEITQEQTVLGMVGHAYVKYTFVEALSSNKVEAGDSFIVLTYQKTQALGTAKNGSKRALVDFDINNPDLTNIEVFKVRAGFKSGYLQFVQRNGYLTKAGTTKLAWNQDNYDSSVASHFDFQIQYKTSSDGSTYEYFSSRSSRDATILNRGSDGFSLSSGYGSFSKIMIFVPGSWTDTGSYVTESGYYTCTREGCGCHLDKTGAKIVEG